MLTTTCFLLFLYSSRLSAYNCTTSTVIVQKNSLSVDNTNLIATKQRRTYLVRSPAGMFWVVLTRVRRGYVRTGVFVVENSKPSTADPAGSQTFGSAAASTHKYRYRVKSIDPERRPRTRVVIKWVGQSSTLSEDLRGGKRGAAEAYAVIKSTTGGMQFSWFPHLVETG
ncbi:Hypothetical protein CINCED_3A023506 [Cinara cedri]|uniref:Uncharacterized protein n=1 Tax=Cinara cedri TaxID=506608 RepID=A0A5E4NMF3_9HEMI|nr:Hypothetical protein CINCED_3A023506 [Cinara cedri]